MPSKTNILVYSNSEAEQYAELIRREGFQRVETAATAQEAIMKLPNTEVIFCWNFPTHLLSRPCAKAVRWVQSMGAGVNDLTTDPTIPSSIRITRIVDQFGTKISEYVFAYLLYILQDIARMRTAQQKQVWDPFRTRSLAGQRIGVAGLGSIGTEMVRKARAFDMEISGLSLSGKASHVVDRHYHAAEWSQFVKDLDVLVLTLPLTPRTKHIISTPLLNEVKDNLLLVNVGRGALIDEDALISSLLHGQLEAAVLDVFETEPLPAESLLWSMGNVYITPHLSGPSILTAVGQFFVENLNRYLNDQPFMGEVDREAGY